MTEVIKKNKQNSVNDLRKSLNKLIVLLEEQDEDAAAADLKLALQAIESSPEGSPKFVEALKQIADAYEGEHDLAAYTLARNNRQGQWGDVEELYLASTGVLNLVRRLSR
jgi:tRNA U38,U39,U40 pseudouridine synthase TruA